VRDGLADHLLALLVALGRVDNVETGVEGGVKKFLNGFRGGAVVSDFGSTKTEGGYLHAGFSKQSFFDEGHG
jgi:hypothetical protein